MLSEKQKRISQIVNEFCEYQSRITMSNNLLQKAVNSMLVFFTFYKDFINAWHTSLEKVESLAHDEALAPLDALAERGQKYINSMDLDLEGIDKFIMETEMFIEEK